MVFSRVNISFFIFPLSLLQVILIACYKVIKNMGLQLLPSEWLRREYVGRGSVGTGVSSDCDKINCSSIRLSRV